MNEDFKYIAAIASCGSISKAAREENISQSALSQRLRRLESKLGCELFDRTSLPLVPTEFGEVVIKYARQALVVEAGMRREMNSLFGSRKQRLCVGTSMPRAAALLTEPIVEFHETYHNCTLELHEMASFDQLHGAFLTGSVDFALLTPIAADPDLYELEALCRERLVIAVSKNLVVPQLEDKPSRVFIRQLEGLPFVLPTCGLYFDPIISHLIDNASLQLDIVIRDCDAHLALSLVEEGIGATIVPSTYVMGRDSLNTFMLADIDAANTLFHIRRRNTPASIEEQRFLRIVRAHLANAQ